MIRVSGMTEMNTCRMTRMPGMTRMTRMKGMTRMTAMSGMSGILG